MESAARVEHLFIVRFWHEAASGEQAVQWRGSVQHTESGRRLYFANIADLVDFLMQRVNDRQAP